MKERTIFITEAEDTYVSLMLCYAKLTYTDLQISYLYGVGEVVTATGCEVSGTGGERGSD